MVLSEVEIVLDEWSADKGVVADTIAANPRIEEREGDQENQAQEKLRLPGAMCRSPVSAQVEPGSGSPPSDEFQLDCKSNQTSRGFCLIGSRRSSGLHQGGVRQEEHLRDSVLLR
jgi:hypothetical protein